MKKLSLPKEELDAFLVRNTNYSDIRKLRVRQALEDGRMDEAIRLLEEGKSAGRGKRGLVEEYSKWLMDLYERQGRRDKLIAELEYHVFVLSSVYTGAVGRVQRTVSFRANLPQAGAYGIRGALRAADGSSRQV